MIFTSGSTGVPKGVVVPLRAIHALVAGMQEVYGFGPHDRFSKAYNLSFDGSIHDMFTCWNAGASLHPVPARQLMAPAKFIQEKQLTMWTSVPSTAVFLERMKMLQPGAFRHCAAPYFQESRFRCVRRSPGRKPRRTAWSTIFWGTQSVVASLLWNAFPI